MDRMTLQDELRADLKTAMREKDEARKSAIRMALAALTYARVEKNADLTDEEMTAALSREVKQRRDAMADFQRAGRDDLVAAEAVEIEVLQAYLPEMLDRDAIEAMAREAIEGTGASSPKQIGQVMRVLMPRVQGRADGRLVADIVKELLTQ
jgi:uncharacterized protein YqeY